ncbi:SDR family NAD(P)-dependent oxidoreductase, partial [Pantoea endophytica]
MNINHPKVHWVIGASGSIGQAIVSKLSESGAVVVVSGRRPHHLPQETDRVYRIPLDATVNQEIENATQLILQRFGRIDGVVNCSTLPLFGDFLSLQDEDWISVINTKLLAAVRCARAVIPTMVKQGEGCLVFISGRGGSIPPPKHLPGSCANASLNLLAQGLATEYGKAGIRVNSVAPGPISSPRLDEMKKG